MQACYGKLTRSTKVKKVGIEKALEKFRKKSGDGPAGEFVAFREISDKLPDIDAIIEDPNKYKRDDNPALLYALANAVAARAAEDKMDKIMKLSDKLTVEYQVVLVKGCLARDRNLRGHPAIKNWITKNANVVL